MLGGEDQNNQLEPGDRIKTLFSQDSFLRYRHHDDPFPSKSQEPPKMPNKRLVSTLEYPSDVSQTNTLVRKLEMGLRQLSIQSSSHWNIFSGKFAQIHLEKFHNHEMICIAINELNIARNCSYRIWIILCYKSYKIALRNY